VTDLPGWASLRVESFADRIAAEEARVAAGEPGCGDSCPCHGSVTCIRVAHPHDADADMGPGIPPGDVVPHVGRDGDGALVQWVCADPEIRARPAAEPTDGREAATRALLASVDPALLVQLLRDGGHL
jgi:hypothetical protein